MRYHIGQLGKYGVGATPAQIASFDVFHADCNQGPPFHDYRGKTVHDSEWLTLETRDFLENIPKDKPFCLQVNYKAPHASSVVADEDKGKLADHTFDAINTYEPRPQTNAPNIDWNRYQKAWPAEYQKIAAQVKRLGVTWDDALNDPEIREAIGSTIGWYY